MQTLQDAYQTEVSTKAATGYERSKLLPGIAHIGVGGFHRAHQAWYMERYNRLQTGESADLQWGIVGIGLLPGDDAFLQKMKSQSCLYSLTLADQKEHDTSVLGSIIDVIAAAKDSQRALDQLASPSIRIISTTITEGGYLFDFESDRFITDHPLVQNDLDPSQPPKSIFGYLTRALQQRRDTGAGPVTLMSCDNVPGNGEVLKKSLMAFLQLTDDPSLVQWVNQNVSFPNSMVDRITPTPSPQLIDDVATRAELDDQCPVLGEPFAQWVIEDNFIAGRPALETVGVEFTPHVENFENLKLRILNGTHIMVSLIGRLQGLTYIHETLADEGIYALARDLMDKDAHPGLGHFTDAEIDAYKATILNRFSNPAIADSVERVASDGYNKLKNYLMPILRECLARGEQSPRIALAFACYLRHLKGVDDHQQAIVINEPQLSSDERSYYADHVIEFLRLDSFFGNDSDAATERFIDRVQNLFKQIGKDGTQAVVKALRAPTSL